tara:strand:- start:4799 stop:4975 length:177 start_codon:yes stop_codon:yes gene_type:complete
MTKWLDGRVVMQRPAKPCTPVRFRLQPPLFLKTGGRAKFIHMYKYGMERILEHGSIWI